MANESHDDEVKIYRPEPSSRHPLILFFLVLIATAGLSIVFGAPAPGSIEESLDPLQVRIWGFSLFGGSVAYLIALFLQASMKVRRFTTGVAFEQVGAASLGSAAILYTAAALSAVGWSGIYPAATTFTFGAACIYRWISILVGIRAFARAQVTTG